MSTTDIVIPPKSELLAPIVAAEAEIHSALEAAKGLTIAGHVEGEKAGFAAVSTARKRLKGLRTSIENARTAAKRPLLEVERALDGEASRLKNLLVPEENRLQKEEDDFRQRQEQARQAAAKAAADALAARITSAKAAGLPVEEVNMTIAKDGDAAAWEKELARLGEVGRLRAIAAERHRAISALGVTPPFGIEEWPEDEFADYLRTAEQAKRDRETQAEADRIEREAVRRRDTLSLLGFQVDVRECTLMTVEEYEAHLSDAKARHAEAKRQADANAAELERLRRQESQRKEAEAEEKRKAEAEEARKKAESKRIRRQAAMRPQLESLAAWRSRILDAVQSAPTVSDPLLGAMRDEAETAIFLAVEKFALAPVAPEPEPEAEESVELEF